MISLSTKISETQFYIVLFFVAFIVIVDANTLCHNANFALGASTVAARSWNIKVNKNIDVLQFARKRF